MPLNLKPKSEGQERCPYCHDALQADPDVVLCSECGTDHHRICALELGRCPVLGCSGRFDHLEVDTSPLRLGSAQVEAFRSRVRERARGFLRRQKEAREAGRLAPPPEEPPLRPVLGGRASRPVQRWPGPGLDLRDDHEEDRPVQTLARRSRRWRQRLTERTSGEHQTESAREGGTCRRSPATPSLLLTTLALLGISLGLPLAVVLGNEADVSPAVVGALALVGLLSCLLLSCLGSRRGAAS